ncbi:lipopolysaccharide kinase InaA family protein [Natroniella acetigena]|uniref:lipopolysaccharide kinase InaA family protein n=1 Tax=Natroniella acetigena TaxID=52004 RepID=UPI00200A4B8C|nr:lipopolysaccharide kinase InaA family protein [Natroniella acetigena]
MVTDNFMVGQKEISISYHREVHNDLTLYHINNEIYPIKRLIELAIKFIHIDDYSNVVRQENGRAVFFVEVNGKRFYFKKFIAFKNIKSRDLFNPLSLSLATKAVKNFKVMLILDKIAVPTCNPILAINYHRGLLSKDSILVIPEIKGENTEQILTSSDYDYSDKEKIIKKIYNMGNKLYQHRIFHGDFYPRNFIFDTEQEQLFLIDLDRAVVNCRSQLILLKDFSKLNRYLFRNLIHPKFSFQHKEEVFEQFSTFVSDFLVEKMGFNSKELRYIFKGATKKILNDKKQEDLALFYRDFIDQFKINL